jgi:hypothetical protein
MEEGFAGEKEEEMDQAEWAETGRFAELEELRREIGRRIRDNQRFLERFMEEDFIDEDENLDDSSPEEEL